MAPHWLLLPHATLQLEEFEQSIPALHAPLPVQSTKHGSRGALHRAARGRGVAVKRALLAAVPIAFTDTPAARAYRRTVRHRIAGGVRGRVLDVGHTLGIADVGRRDILRPV